MDQQQPGESPEAYCRRVWGVVFDRIDEDGSEELTRRELREWFERSPLTGLMSFKEFYLPIALMDVDGNRMTNKDEFVAALELFRSKSDVWGVARKNISFWLGLVFIVAGIW